MCCSRFRMVLHQRASAGIAVSGTLGNTNDGRPWQTTCRDAHGVARMLQVGLSIQLNICREPLYQTLQCTRWLAAVIVGRACLLHE